MARVRILDPEMAEGEVARFFEATKKLRGRVPHASRVWAHIPHIAKFHLAFGAVLQREGAGGVLSTKIKEMVVIKTSQVNGCAY